MSEGSGGATDCGLRSMMVRDIASNAFSRGAERVGVISAGVIEGVRE